ncbi:hypothetical protein MAR_036294 [Mya arenaria]|uniref:Uncharacterized protein n=1 Tax=Mya arenaria TaxID=6604 RepID=A0ABY7EMK1_MYAAR|nr:hypothetical protein MAR_036294 [Mya arenaria]
MLKLLIYAYAILCRYFFPCVRNKAKTFKVYSYVRRRIDEAIKLCKDDTRSPMLCSPNICIIFPDNRPGTSTNYCEAFNDTQDETFEKILDEDQSVIVSVGANEEYFATLRQQAEVKLMPPIICKVTCENPTNMCTAGKHIYRKSWGFECFEKDLSKENVVACIDDVLEYYAFEMLDRATKHLPESDH